MMNARTKNTIVLMTLILSFNIFAVARQEEDQRQALLDNEDTGGRGRLISRGTEGDDNQPGSMEKISEMFPSVKQAYTACNSDSPPNNKTPTDACMWEAIGQQEQEKILKYIEEEKENQLADGQTKVTSSEGNFRKTRSKSERKLEEYLKKKLEKVLYDENAQGSKVLNDHGTFYDLYKSQIGQNIIRVSADACMYADYHETLQDGTPNSQFGWIDKGNTDFKEKNLSNLSVVGQVQRSNGSTRETSQSYKVFNRCIITIPNQCKGGKQEACKVLKYMELAKNGIKDLDGIREQLNSYGNSKGQQNVRHSGVQIREKANQEGLAEAVVITSGDIDRAEIEDEISEETALLRKCAEEDGTLSGDCALYLTDAEEKQKIEQEFLIRQKAIEERVKKLLEESKGNPDEQQNAIRKILAEEGLSEDKIEEYLSQNDNDVAVKDITKRYEEKRRAVIDDLKSRTERVDKTVLGDPTQNNRSTFENLARESDTKVQSLKESIQFANIVGSFIEIGEQGSSELTNNTAALVRELSDSGFEENSERSLDQDQMNNIRELAGSGSSEDTLPNLSSEQVEDLIYNKTTNENSTTSP